MGSSPTDAEIIALADETRTGEPGRDGYILPISFARAVLQRWGQPSGAGEPVAWYVTGCGRLLDEDEAKAEARHIGGTARAIPLYTTPQPSPAAQGNALDAARYAIVRRGQHWSVIDGLGDPLTGDRLDAAVDAVCAAQESN